MKVSFSKFTFRRRLYVIYIRWSAFGAYVYTANQFNAKNQIQVSMPNHKRGSHDLQSPRVRSQIITETTSATVVPKPPIQIISYKATSACKQLLFNYYKVPNQTFQREKVSTINFFQAHTVYTWSQTECTTSPLTRWYHLKVPKLRISSKLLISLVNYESSKF